MTRKDNVVKQVHSKTYKIGFSVKYVTFYCHECYKGGLFIIFKVKWHFSQNVNFGVPGQNISRTAGPNCMNFSRLIYINKMCVLNE